MGVSFRGAQRIYCVGGYRKTSGGAARAALPVLPASIEIARKTNAAYVFLLCFFSALLSPPLKQPPPVLPVQGV